jgi:hypothetical protein
MANKYDAAALAANADRLEALAKTARSTMLSGTTEKATRLGSEGERLARQARATEAQRADADKLSADLLSEAAQFDARAQALRQRAAAAAARGDYAGQQEATELGEEAAKAREGANVARAKSQVAAGDGKRLAEEAAALREHEQAIDAELADLGGRMPATELAVDHLEWHAEKARAMADAVRQADEMQVQASAAAGRGDHVAADALTIRASTLRDDADVLAFVRDHPPFPADLRPLAVIGVTVTDGDLSVPLPELIDPNSTFNPLADASTGIGETAEESYADATELVEPAFEDAFAGFGQVEESSFAIEDASTEFESDPGFDDSGMFA